jgi:hypothetical protein
MQEGSLLWPFDRQAGNEVRAVTVRELGKGEKKKEEKQMRESLNIQMVENILPTT